MEGPIKTLMYGNWLMGICFSFYLAWWITAFRPPEPKSTPVTVGLLGAAFVTGLAGLYLCGSALTAPIVPVQPGISNLRIVGGGVAAYLLFLAVTALAFHRQITSELLLITAWAALELCIVNTLYQCGNLTPGTAFNLVLLTLAGTLISLVCYVLYYRVSYVASYIDGCIPLALAIAVILTVNLHFE